MIAMYEWIMLHMWLSSVAHMDGSYCTYEWVAPHIWMSPVAHINESCCTHEWVKVAHTNESYRTYEWIILQIWMRRFPHSRSPAQQRRRNAVSYTATLCNTLKHTATHCNTDYRHSKGGAQENDAAEHPRSKPAHVSLCCTVCCSMLHSRQWRNVTSPQQACSGESLLQCVAQCVAQRVAQHGVVRCSVTCEALLRGSATCEALQARPILRLKNLSILSKEPYVC